MCMRPSNTVTTLDTFNRMPLSGVALAFVDFPGEGGGVLPYMGYIGKCGAKGYGSAVLVINRVSLLAILPPFW